MTKMTKGRQKIELKKIEKINSRQVAFSKRRNGLFKKASEICVLTRSEAAVFVSSPGGRIFFAFGDPNLFDRYPNNHNKEYSTNNDAQYTQNFTPMINSSQHYAQVSRELEAEKKRTETIPVSSDGSRWFDKPFDGVDVNDYICSLEEFKKKVLTRADELMN